MKYHDLNTMRAMIKAVGGENVEGEGVQFDIPLADVRQKIPVLEQLINDPTVGCRRVSHREDFHPTKYETIGIVRVEVYRRGPEELQGATIERNLLTAMKDR